MDITWKVTGRDISKVRDLIAQFENHQIAQERIERNITHSGISKITKESFWQGMLVGLLTTQQKSGKGSPVEAFLNKSSNPLGLQNCLSQKDLETHAEKMLRSGGIWRAKIIAPQIIENLRGLEKTGWKIVEILNTNLPCKDKNIDLERQIAHEIAELLTGIGSKQSRNLLQYLGLTKYEIPLDSRFIKWIDANLEFPIKVTPKGLADPFVYDFVLDGIQILCERAGILPCVFDAAVFASGENDNKN